MSVNGTPLVLAWPGKVLCEEDLRKHLTSHREIVLMPKAIITPLAMDLLMARKIAIRREEQTSKMNPAAGWGYAEEVALPLVSAAVKALASEGIRVQSLGTLQGPVESWLKALAKKGGSIVFCADPALVCCLANKIGGLRAAAVATPKQVTRVRQSLAPNFYAVEMPGRTLFEIKQIIQHAVLPAACPIPEILKELDGHAHR